MADSASELHPFLRSVLEHMRESNHHALGLPDLFDAAERLGRIPQPEREQVCIQILVAQDKLARGGVRDPAVQLLLLVMHAVGLEQALKMAEGHNLPSAEELKKTQALMVAQQQELHRGLPKPPPKGAGLRAPGTKKGRGV